MGNVRGSLLRQAPERPVSTHVARFPYLGQTATGRTQSVAWTLGTMSAMSACMVALYCELSQIHPARQTGQMKICDANIDQKCVRE